MRIWKKFRKRCPALFVIISFLLVASVIFQYFTVVSAEEDNKEVKEVIEKVFALRNKALLDGNLDIIEAIYDKNTRYGTWAFEYEIRKMKYIKSWQEKQGIKFTEIYPKVVFRKIRKNGDNYSINLLCSTEYRYTYEDEPDKTNISRIGTYHIININGKDGIWTIQKEWYKDPFADSLNLNNFKKIDSLKEYALSQKPRDFTNLNKKRIAAAEYAEKYCGAASEEKYGYKYNKKYRDYNPKGGDCANFASQILYEGGKFRKNGSWNYDAGGATGPWVNADKFKSFMVNSGRASVIAYGSYEKVFKASYSLQPGDFVAYESKGDITHISVVTGADSKGYSLVSCHNTDRNKVPWDLGWSDKNMKFWLVRVHY